ncbi:MAG: formylglycine-generating enzyme family protein, partial [Planctomycetota bacterium]
TIDMVDYSPTVTIEGPWIAADSASGAAAIVNIAGHASVYVYGDMEGAMASGTSFELNMSEDAYLEVSGGWLRVADDSGASAAINMSDSATLEVYDILRGSDTGSAWFATNMSGGYLFCYGFSIGDEGGGEVNIDGGTMDVDGDMDLGGARGSDPIAINVTSGLLSVWSGLLAPSNTSRDGAVTIDLDGGTIECDWFDHAEVAYHMDIAGGTFRIAGDWVADMQADKAAGYITAYDGEGTVNINLVSGYTEVTGSPPDPNRASNPDPPDGGAVFTADVNLGWTPGLSAVKHDVYLGTDFNDVNEATDPNVLPGRGRQDSNSYHASGLELYKTYYWRIDEVNSPPCFTMGVGNDPFLADDGSKDYDEQPGHLVEISKDFYVLETKVEDVHYQQSGLPGAANDVNWSDANAFCTWLSNVEGKTYHLPTEAQWEFVYENPWGVQDMSEREWVQDWHRTYINDGQVDPVGPPTGMLKVIRGGNESNRWALPTNARYEPWHLGEAQACGFRAVLETEPPVVPYVAPPQFTQAALKQSTAPALQGPDPNIPYFTVRFAMPIPPDNRDEYGALAGVCQSIAGHNHSPGFEIMPNGDALAVWFSGPYGSEYGSNVRFVQSRLRYGSDMWDMPELFWDMKGMNDESGLLWTEEDGTIHFFGGGRIANSNKRPFVMAISTDSGATWDVKRPYFPVPAVNFQAQPCQ